MDKFDVIKAISRRMGVYKTARWVNRNILNREELIFHKKEMVFYSEFVGPGDLVFDIGANYGLKTDVFLELGGKVVVVEPQKDCMSELQERLGYNNSNLIAVETAVGAYSGSTTFYVRAHRGASGLIMDWEGDIESSIDVPITTLDNLIARYGLPRFCKIDVEGMEIEVLKGLTVPIPVLSLEYHLRDAEIPKTIECVEYLSRMGKLHINLTPEEVPCFAFKEWLNKEQFMKFFLEQLHKLKGYEYGNIVLKISH